jgi:hypothetical protein
MRGILIFFNIVKFVGHTIQILSLQYLSNVLRFICLFTIAESTRKLGWIVSMSPVLLNFTWLIDMGFPEFFETFRSTWMLDVFIGSYVKVSVLSFTDTNDLMTSLSDVGNRVISDSYRLLQGSTKWAYLMLFF